MKRLKIGIFMDDYYPSVNGVILVMDNYAKRLSKFADVTVVVPYTDKKYVDDFPYKVIRVNSIKLHFIDYSLANTTFNIKLEKKLMKEEFDIIHIHSPFTMGNLGIHIAKKLNIPVIATMHTQFDLEFKRYSKSDVITAMLVKLIMYTFNACYKCFAVNKKVAEIFYNYGAKEMPGVLNNGTELKLVSDENQADDEVNKKFNLNKDETIFLFLGRVNILKNVLFIVDVMNELKKRNVKYKMLFVGPLEDGDILKEKVDELGLSNDVIFTGKIMDRDLISKIYHRAKLFIFPSLYDASSLVQIEAASQKTPTIFIEGAATACSVINNVDGFLAPNNVFEFASRIEEILKNDELYEKVSLGCYKDIYRSWDDLTLELFNTYKKIIKDYKNKKRRLHLK